MIMKIDEKTYIGRQRKKYAVYSLLGRKRLTKFYDSIEELDENIYIAKDEKSGKLAFLSSRFSTKNEYTKILKILDEDINENLYAGFVEEEERIDILTRVDKIDIKELSEKEAEKIINLLHKNKEGSLQY